MGQLSNQQHTVGKQFSTSAQPCGYLCGVKPQPASEEDDRHDGRHLAGAGNQPLGPSQGERKGGKADSGGVAGSVEEIPT